MRSDRAPTDMNCQGLLDSSKCLEFQDSLAVHKPTGHQNARYVWKIFRRCLKYPKSVTADSADTSAVPSGRIAPTLIPGGFLYHGFVCRVPAGFAQQIVDDDPGVGFFSIIHRCSPMPACTARASTPATGGIAVPGRLEAPGDESNGEEALPLTTPSSSPPSPAPARRSRTWRGLCPPPERASRGARRAPR